MLGTKMDSAMDDPCDNITTQGDWSRWLERDSNNKRTRTIPRVDSVDDEAGTFVKLMSK